MSRHAHPRDLTAEHRVVVVEPHTNPLMPAVVPVRLPVPRPAGGGGPVSAPAVTAPVGPVAAVAEVPGGLRAHDGGRGNPLRRAEPKVRAAALAALLTPVVLFYARLYVPGLDAMPVHVLVAVDGLVTGVVAFVAGFLAKAVDRVDLFPDAE